MTNKIIKHGFVLVTSTPFDNPETTKKLLERIAFIRETHYGGFYDFTPDLAMADTAYTNLALPAHTDTTYFTEPAGLQAFHLLSHTPAPGADNAVQAAEGGKSLLVDGFHAAKILQEEDLEAFNVLATKGVLWHASGNKDISITPYKWFPVIEKYGRVVQRIRWNNDDRGVLPLERPSDRNHTAISATAWYDAARKWNEILRWKEMECWIQLKPGNVLSMRPLSMTEPSLNLITNQRQSLIIGVFSMVVALSRASGGYAEDIVSNLASFFPSLFPFSFSLFLSLKS